MAIEIREIDGVICVKGNISQNQLAEVENYFTTLLKYEKKVLINLTQVEVGLNPLQTLLKSINKKLTQGREMVVFGNTPSFKNHVDSLKLAA